MQHNHLLAIKQRVLDEVNDSLGKHPLYRDDTKAYHKYHPLKERPQSGITLGNTSSRRLVLSPDDYMADMESHCALANVEGKPGTSIEWVWEDSSALTKYSEKEDVTASISSDRYYVQTSNPNIVSGKSNTKPATSIGEIDVYIDGVRTFASGLNAKEGLIYFASPIPQGSTVEVSYWWSNLDVPGYYFIEIASKDAFILTPLYIVKGEEVIKKTTGLELEAQIKATSGVQQSPFILWTKKMSNSVKLYLEVDKHYQVDSSGLITLLEPLPKDTTLYASYRWQGENRGPFEVAGEYSYNNKAIRGVSIAFGSRINVGDKQVVFLFPEREQNARVYGGHYEMSFDLRVFSRDPQSAAEIADYVLADLWSNKRSMLCAEGLTITEMDPSGEGEESYDDSTGAMYFEQSLSLSLMSEWKKFVPYVVDISRFDIRLHGLQDLSVTLEDEDGKINTVPVLPLGENFEIEYPKRGFPRYF